MSPREGASSPALRRRRPWAWIAAAAAAGAVFGFHHLADPDLFFQVAVGREVLRDPGTLGVGTIVDGHVGRAYVADKWLASVVVAALDRAGGTDALMLYQIALAIGLGLAWRALARAQGASEPHAAVAVAVAFVAAAFRTEPRPETWSLLLAAAVATVFLRVRTTARLAVAFAATMVLWVNAHGYFVLGGAIAAAAVAASILGDRALPGLSGATALVRARKGLAVVAAGAVACCVHPQGLAAVIWPIRQLRALRDEPVLREAILELQPVSVLFAGATAGHVALATATLVLAVALAIRSPRRAFWRIGAPLACALPWCVVPPGGLTQWPYRVALATVVVAVFEIAPAVRRRAWFPVFVVVGFAVLSAGAIRNVAIVPPFAAAFVAAAWTGLAARSGGSLARGWRTRTAPAVVAVCALVVAGWMRASDRLPPGTFRAPGWTGWGIDRDVVPTREVDALLKRPAPAASWNNFEAGGYLAYRTHPDRRVFIAGDTSMYPASFLERYRTDVVGAVDGRGPGGEPVGAAFLSTASLETTDWIAALARSGQWRLAAPPRAAVWFERGARDARRERTLVEAAVDLTEAEAKTRSWLPAWLGGRRRVYPLLNRAIALESLGYASEAYELAEIAIGPGGRPDEVAVLAEIAERAGRLGAAVPRLERAADLDPGSLLVRSWLARALFVRGIAHAEASDGVAAERDLQRAWELAPDAPGPALALARLHGERGPEARAEAVRWLERALAASPDAATREAVSRDPVLRDLGRSTGSNSMD